MGSPLKKVAGADLRTRMSSTRGPHLCRLLFPHLVKNGDHPVLESLVAVVGHQQVPDSLQSSGAQIGPGEGEIAPVCGRKAFDEVFRYASGGGNQHVHLQIEDKR